MSRSKKRLLVIVIAFLVVFTAGPGACGSSDNASTVSIEPTPTQEEVDAYWVEENAKEAIRQEAIRRDAVVVRWEGNWNQDTKLALFRGQGHVSDVKVGTQYMDLVERDQITLKEYKIDVNDVESWATIASISNNLQPGSVQVFIR